MNIGDLFLKVIADAIDFKADVVKQAKEAGDEAGATLGQRMGAAIKSNGAKIIGAGLAIAGGIAVRGIAELQQVTADFRAETGATADEADRAKKAILAMSGRNLQPLGEIGQALTKVHTDLGLVGDQAERETELFLRFGRVTKRNAADEVAAFDDILDSWNLTADKTGAVMDALIVSHQKFGGVISDDERALAALAPALLAANQTWEDGLALINLFKASGADVADAVTGITKALGKVKSPAELKALIADIIATEDPLLRATKAADLFGSKAGAKLANVLKPGIGGLDAFKQSAEENAGALDKEVEVLDGTFGAWFQHLLKAAGTAIIGFGDQWGGLATVIATALTVAGGIAGKFGQPLIDGLKDVWKKVAASAAVTGAVKIAAGKAASVYLATLIAGDAIGAALSRAWAATGARLLTAAGISGGAAGTAFAYAMAAAIIAAPLAVIYVAIRIADDVRQAKAGLAGQIDKVIQEGTLEGLQHAKDVLQAQIGSEKILGIIPFQFAGEVDAMNAQIARIDAAIAALPPTVKTVTTAAASLSVSGSRSFEDLGNAGKRLAARIRTDAAAITTLIHTLTTKLVGEAQALISGYYDPIIAQDELRVQKDTAAANQLAVNAARAALAKTKAGTEERRQAQLTLDQALLTQHQSQASLDQTRLNLLAAGKLSAKDQKAWLAELQKKYKSATGAAKTDIGNLIAKLHELQHQPTTVVQIIAKLGFQNIGNIGKSGARAAGGPVVAGRAYLVNENTPNSEIFVPGVSGRILTQRQAAAAVSAGAWQPGAGGGDTYNNSFNVAVEGLIQARTPLEIAREMRRVASFAPSLVKTRPSGTGTPS